MRIDSQSKQESGFTLIELSIVLVIIGLIVGGILVGQDMIRAAEIRSTIKQFETFNTAANTFRDKYRFLPGDLTGTNATNSGFTTRTGAAGRGDGNGLLQSAATTGAASKYLGYETGLFWRDLSGSSMIEGSFITATDAFPALLDTPEKINAYIPAAKLGRGNFIIAFGDGGFNYYQIGGITSVAVTGIPTLAKTMTPQEASNIDGKMDDAAGLTGIVTSALTTGGLGVIDTAATPAAGVCVSNVTGTPYNTSTTDFANAPSCALKVRFN